MSKKNGQQVKTEEMKPVDTAPEGEQAPDKEVKEPKQHRIFGRVITIEKAEKPAKEPKPNVEANDEESKGKRFLKKVGKGLAIGGCIVAAAAAGAGAVAVKNALRDEKDDEDQEEQALEPHEDVVEGVFTEVDDEEAVENEVKTE